jgi:division protein CdvB (Snf7/Vps24/ESCRT-III family)
MKTKKNKSTKAVTLLTKIETLLSDVLDECAEIEKSVEKNVQEILVTAQQSISAAIDFISALPAAEVKPKAAKRKVRAKGHVAVHVGRKHAVKA